MTFKLKPASKGDIDFLVNLRKQTMSEHLDAAGWLMDDAGHLERVLINFEDCYVIEIDQEAIGMVKYLSLLDKIFVMQVQILAKFQGRGMGREVIEYLIELAKADSKHAELHVLKANPAKQLYERLGFVVYDEDKLEFHMTTKR
jgi:ribosomal protein S18 acetylase RimI-like enzyme